VQQSGNGNENQRNTDAQPPCGQSWCSFDVTRTTQQQRATDDQDGREEDTESADECTGNLGQSAAERTSEVAVDAEGGQQPEGNERDSPYVMTMTCECFTNGTGRGPTNGSR
jgi:hypothetical protein